MSTAPCEAARHAFEAGRGAGCRAVERGRCLTALSACWSSENGAELAALESRDTGKPLRQGRADVAAAMRYFEFYGGAADKIHGDTIPFLDGYTALTLREPHGVVAGIIPWNYPLQILSRVAGAALAMGNTLVVKPAEDASLTDDPHGRAGAGGRLSARRLQRRHRLWPRGRRSLGRPSAGRLRHLHRLAARPARRSSRQLPLNNRGVTMELGGKSPQLVFADADIEAALPVLVATQSSRTAARPARPAAAC